MYTKYLFISLLALGVTTNTKAQSEEKAIKTVINRFFEGLENGIHKYYFDNGKLKEERTYRLGLKEGQWKTYDTTGELLLSTTYKSGEVVKFDGVKVGN